MARDVDRILDYVREADYIPPVHRQVIINRIDVGEPTQEELERAQEELERAQEELERAQELEAVLRDSRGDKELAEVFRRFLGDQTETAELDGAALQVGGWVSLNTEDEERAIKEAIRNG